MELVLSGSGQRQRKQGQMDGSRRHGRPSKHDGVRGREERNAHAKRWWRKRWKKSIGIGRIRRHDCRWPFKRHRELDAKADPLRKAGLPNCDEQSTLPLHLIVQHILVRLPMRQICQLRCVCKAWNAILSLGGSIADMSFPLHEEEEYWFVMRSFGTPDRVFSIQSSHERHSFPFPLLSDKLLSCLGGFYCKRLSISEEFMGNWLMASAGGLLCALVRSKMDRYFDVIVFNCLTGLVKVLPPPLRPRELLYCYPYLMYMAVDDRDPSRYYVMLSGSLLMVGGGSSYKEVYDSGTGIWKVVGNNRMMSSGLKVPSGDFFDLQCAPPSDSMTILAYHVALDAWSTVQVPWYRPSNQHPYFHKYKGRLFQARFLENSNTSMAFGVWELRFASAETSTWVELSRTPAHLLPAVPEASMTVEAEGALFYTRAFTKEGPLAPMVYDISKNAWYVQPLPLEQGLDFVFVHRPRLSMFFC